MGDPRIGMASLLSIGSGAMPGPRLPVRKIRDVLRLSAAGMSKRQIAVSLGVSPTAARDCILRAWRAGLRWPLPERPDGRDAGGSALSVASGRQQGTATAAGLGDGAPRAAPARGDAAAVVGGASRRQSLLTSRVSLPTSLAWADASFLSSGTLNSARLLWIDLGRFIAFRYALVLSNAIKSVSHRDEIVRGL